MIVYYLIYITVMSIVAYILYAVDKRRAIHDQRRISEKVLLTISILGGAIGGYITMVTLRHKTKHWYFNVINIVSIVVHIAIGIAILLFV